ncbi:hypothetical protein [Motilimonas pumila]|uniref:Uncharacterized protein n=1 Tax=Motilimonas pumila TaxID=2303987 RepID=A0A418YJU9_9GAMM|nr:hypothetical protein [Motilimonas pumila]RJG51244.1 hypothetical protein D1Z90_00475 [Motilimonas pumila]
MQHTKIINFDLNPQFGLVWVDLLNKRKKRTFTVQCFTQDMAIEKQNCGHNEGLCGDVNEAAFNYYGEGKCMEVLFTQAQKAGITVA